MVMVIARALGAVAPIRPDRWHARPVALHGGLAMIGVLLIAALGWRIDWLPGRPAEGMPIEASPIGWVFLAALCAGVVGFADDLLHMRPATKLAMLFGAATVLVTGLGFGGITGVVWIDIPLTYLWILFIANAVNMLDNMDGIAAGMATIASAGIAAVAAARGEADTAVMAAAVAAACVGFLVWNRPRASLFMGDSGSLFLGTMLAGLAALATGWMGPRATPCDCVVQGITPIAASALLLALPIADAKFVSFTRLARGQSPMVGGRDHTTHRVARLAASRGWGRGRLCALALSAMVAGPLLAVATVNSSWAHAPLAAAIALAVFGSAVLDRLAKLVPVHSRADAMAEGTSDTVAAQQLAKATDGIDALPRELGDALLVGLIVVVSYALRFGWPLPADSAIVLRHLVPVTIAACLLANAAVGVYEPRAPIGRGILAALLGFLAAIGLEVMLDWLPVGFSRFAWIIGLVVWTGAVSLRMARAATRHP